MPANEYHQRASIIIGSPDDVALAEDFYRRLAYSSTARKDDTDGQTGEADPVLVRVRQPRHA